MDFLKNTNINADGPSPAAAHVALTQEQLHEGIFDKINDALSGDPKSKKACTRLPKPISILDKTGGDIKSSVFAAPTPPPTATPKQESFLGKIGNVSHQVAVQTSQSTLPAIVNEDLEGLLDKLWDVLHERNKPATFPVLKEDEGSLDKKVIIMGKSDERPEKPHGLLKKLDSAPGDRADVDQKVSPSEMQYKAVRTKAYGEISQFSL